MNKRITALLLACALLGAPPGLALTRGAEPPYTVDGYTLILHEGVKALGRDAANWAGAERGDPAPADITFDPMMIPLKRVAFPSTLRYLGGDAFIYYSFSRIELPESLEYLDSDSFYNCYIGTLVLPSTFMMSADGFLSGVYIGRVEVSEANPYLKSVDGVLYSKDGTTLHYYPNARRDTFFEVPAGVETIDDFAFSDNHFLQGVSLPLGLRRIGRGAFSHCGRLASVALPLTLESLGDAAFSDCVSLQRVSPPPGMALLTSVFNNCPLLIKKPAWLGDEGGTELGPVQYPDDLWYFNSWGWNAVYGGEGFVQAFKRPDSLSAVIAQLPDWTMVKPGKLSGDWLEVSWAASDENAQEKVRWQKGYVPYRYSRPLSSTLSWRGEGELFTLFDAIPVNPDVKLYAAPFADKEEAPARRAGGLPFRDFRLDNNQDSVLGDWVEVYFIEEVIHEDGLVYSEEGQAYGSVFDFTFTRARTGDSRTLCLLLPRDRMEPLLTAPDGGTLATLYIGTQAEVLSQGEEYTRVRVGGQEGYVRTASVAVVPEENEGGRP